MTSELTHFTLDLTEAEQQELVKLLEEKQDELRDEIRHTDARAYREGLLHEEVVLHSLMAKVGQLRSSSGG